MEYADGSRFECLSFCKYISRLASWNASNIFASLIICLTRFSIAGSELSSKTSEILSLSSNVDWIGIGGATSLDLFRPQPVKALQNGRLALFVSTWFELYWLLKFLGSWRGDYGWKKLIFIFWFIWWNFSFGN